MLTKADRIRGFKPIAEEELGNEQDQVFGLDPNGPQCGKCIIERRGVVQDLVIWAGWLFFKF